LAFVLKLAAKTVGECREHFWQIDLHDDVVVADVDSAGYFLAEPAAFEFQPIARPLLFEGDGRPQRARQESAGAATGLLTAQPGDQVLLELAEAFGNALFGDFSAK
jgi:hypothetical protein